MRITAGLMKRIRGHLYRGKNRVVFKVTPRALAELKLNYEIEEKNMFYLRHTYLTSEESHGHTKIYSKQEKWFENKRAERDKKFSEKHKLLEDRLSILMEKENWDVIK